MNILTDFLNRKISNELFKSAFRMAAPYPAAEDAAKALFNHVLCLLKKTPTKITIDIRDPELREAEFFGKFDHPLLKKNSDPLTMYRLAASPDSIIHQAMAPSLDIVLSEIVTDTGWYSTNGFAIVIDDQYLIDRIYDGIALDLVSCQAI